MSASDELQKVIFETLTAAPQLTALIGQRVYDGIPKDRQFPHLSFGPSQEIADDEECIDGEEHILQIDVWDRAGGDLNGAKRISGVVKALLHDAELVLPDPYALAFIRVRDTQVFRDPDGLTAHGIVSVVAMVEL